MPTPREEFLAGERPDDVALYLADDYVSDERLSQFGTRVDDGVVIVVEGARGKDAFQAATGMEAMSFAKTAMELEGTVDDDLAGGSCPETDREDEHAVQFAFAFAEEQNEDIGGLYADGDVVHAYARCTCGAAYSDKWNVSET